MIDQLRTFWNRVPDKWKAALHTAWIAALAQFAPSLFGFLADLQEWASGTGEFPAVSPLGKAVAAGLVGLVAFLANFIFRSIVPPPQYPPLPLNPPAQSLDEGSAEVGVLLHIFALIAFLIVGLMGAGWLFAGEANAPIAWLGFGLAAVELTALIP